MSILNFISTASIPIIILTVVCFGVKERKAVFDLFLEGAKDGIKIIYNIFPTLIGLFIAINLLRVSGIIELITKYLTPIISLIGIPKQVIPIALLRPVSGSSTIAVATDIMKTYGVDTNIGLITSTIMGSTETTLYTIAIYTSKIKSENVKKVLAVALIGDLIGIVSSVVIWRFLS